MAWQEGDIGFFDDLDDVEDLEQEGDNEVDFMEGYKELNFEDQDEGATLEEYYRYMADEED
jgi:hypothetical protein